MTARTLIYRLMVCAPAIFLLGLGVHARALNDDFEFVANDIRTEDHVRAYVPVLQQTRAILQATSIDNRLAARDAAHVWIQAAELGSLKSLTPVWYLDASNEGAKREIFEVQGSLIQRLNAVIRDEVNAGELDEAASDTIQALQISSIAKYSDFMSLYGAAAEQRRTIQIILPRIAGLKPRAKSMLLTGIEIAKSDAASIGKVSSRTKELFSKWRQSKGFRPLSFEESQLVLNDLGSNSHHTPSPNFYLASNDDSAPELYSAVRLGLSTQRLLDDDLAKLAKSLTK